MTDEVGRYLLVRIPTKGAGLIGRDSPAFAATSVLSLGLFAPLAMGAVHAHAGSLTFGAVRVAVSDLAVPAQPRATDVTIVSGSIRLRVLAAGPTVADVLRREGIALGTYDRVTPKPDQPLHQGEQITIVRVTEWVTRMRRSVAAPVEHRISYQMRPGAVKVLSRGKPGEEEVTLRYIQREGKPLATRIVSHHLLAKPKPKVIAEGVGDWSRFRTLASRGGASGGTIAYTAIEMRASAYTPYCAGCDGYTATGQRAGYGIVAVDPSFIPLGTRLFIPGYGPAIAGDTGSAIRGDRIDLCFDTRAEAMAFGRRAITVYVLR